MNKGYQVIEPAQLNDLVVNPKHDEFTVAVLQWLVEELRLTWDKQPNVEIEVIRVTYFEPYPALGVHFAGKTAYDVGPVLEAEIDRLLNNRPVIDLVRAIARSTVSWKEVADTLMKSDVKGDG